MLRTVLSTLCTLNTLIYHSPYEALSQWWLNLCVNLTSWGYPDQTLFLGVSKRVFLDEISLWIGDLRKADYPPRYGWHQPICWRPEQNKRQGREEFALFFLPSCLFELGHWSSLDLRLVFKTWLTLVLRPLNLDWITPLAFLGFQLADDRSWDFSASIIT